MKQGLTAIALLALAAVTFWYSLSPRFPIAQGLDLKGGMRVVLEPDPTKLGDEKIDEELMNSVRNVLETRVNSFGLSGTEVRLKGANQVLILLPDAKKPQEALDRIKKVAQLEFRHLNNVINDQNPGRRYRMDVQNGDATKGEPDLYSFTDTSTSKKVSHSEVLKETTLLVKGNYLKPNSRAVVNPTNGEPQISFQFNSDGARQFGTFTTENVGEHLAIVLDNEIISAPTINEPITEGEGVITGSATMAEARVVANLMNSGALPIPMRVAETQIVGATLGQESIDRSISAGLAGLGVVLLFMLCYYWLPGFLACLALLFYAALSFSIFKGIPGVMPPIVLDLPGITGFILSVGMAVDANILIFERLKEEMKAGKTLHAAVDAGFSRAFSSILDSNVTTWIVCAILVWLGAPIIKGFAITLAIGVAVSMFTAITVTRTLLHLVLEVPALRNPALYGLNVSWLALAFPAARQGAILRVFDKRRAYFGFSIILAALALAFTAMTPFGKGLQPGVDFTGGSVIEAAYRDNKVTKEQVEDVLRRNGVQDFVVSIGRSEVPWTRATLEASDVDPLTQQQIRERLLNNTRGFDPAAYKVLTQSGGRPVSSLWGQRFAQAATPAAPTAEPSAAGTPASAPSVPPANAPAPNGPAANTPPDVPPLGNAPSAAAPAGTGSKPFRVEALFTADVTEQDIRDALKPRPNTDDADLRLKNLKVALAQIPHTGGAAIAVADIRSPKLDPDKMTNLKAELEKIGGGIIEAMYQQTSIGPSVAREVTGNAFISVFAASLAIILYLAFRFAIGGFINGMKFGVCAVIALVHDVGIVIGLFALMGAIAGWQIDSLFVTAALTILGFSVHDTIVVYDRIRENLRHRLKGESFADVSDRSITQTFDRSLNTSLTVLLVVAALVLFGGDSIRLFNIALLVGIGIGTYSSIFVASPLVVILERATAARSAQTQASSARPSRRDDSGARREPPAPARPRPAPVSDGARAAADAQEAAARPAAGGAIKPRKKRRM